MRKVFWTTEAKHSLDHFCEYIAKGSPYNAQRVRKKIIQTSKALANNPFLFQLDELFINNLGNIRRFIEWEYRVVYQITDDKIIILNIYHSRLNPDKIK